MEVLEGGGVPLEGGGCSYLILSIKNLVNKLIQTTKLLTKCHDFIMKQLYTT